jgi:hypothetical protein
MSGIPILTYHSLHAPGDCYAENDHIALEVDLLTIHQAGFAIVPLSEIAERLISEDWAWFEAGRKLGISFDDGCNHDFIDFEFPGIPTLKSFRTILESFNRSYSPKFPARATSFVIASPIATAILDKACIAGRGQWHNGWWREASSGGLIEIGNHSWDHLHSCLPFVCHTLGVRDDFSRVDNQLDAAMQIEQAESYIRQIIGKEHATGLFAYPDGRASDYLKREYFPRQREIRAAFGTQPGTVTGASDRWYLPRYICGNHWTTPEGLANLLA